MIRFIDTPGSFLHRVHLHDVKKPPRGWFHNLPWIPPGQARGCSRRKVRDAALVEQISKIHAENYGVYGIRKMWHALRRQGITIGREQTARLMRLAGVSGKGKGRSPITTRRPKTPDPRPDLVKRNFKAPGPNRLWVADITYVRTRQGFVYAAFVTDVYSRRIVGWALSDSMRTSSSAVTSTQPGDCVR